MANNKFKNVKTTTGNKRSNLENKVDNLLSKVAGISVSKSQFNSNIKETNNGSSVKNISVNIKENEQRELKIDVDSSNAEKNIDKLAKKVDTINTAFERLKSTLAKLSSMKSGGNFDVSGLLKNLDSIGGSGNDSKIFNLIRGAVGNDKSDFNNNVVFGRLKGSLTKIKADADTKVNEILQYVEGIDKFLEKLDSDIKKTDTTKKIDINKTPKIDTLKRGTKNVSVDDILKTFGAVDVTIANAVKKANKQQEALNRLYDNLLQLSEKTGIATNQIGKGLSFNLTKLPGNKGGQSTKNRISLDAVSGWNETTASHEIAHSFLSNLAKRLHGADTFKKMGSMDAVNSLFDNTVFNKIKNKTNVDVNDIKLAEMVRNIVAKAIDKKQGNLFKKIDDNATPDTDKDYYKRGSEIFARLFARGITGKARNESFELDQATFNKLIAPQLTKLVEQMYGRDAQQRIKITGSNSKTNQIINVAKNRLKQNTEEKEKNAGITHDDLSSARESFASKVKSAVSDSNSFEQNIKNVLNSSVKHFEESFKSAITNIAEIFKNQISNPIKEITVSFGTIVTALRQSGIITNNVSSNTTNSLKNTVRRVVNTEYENDEPDIQEEKIETPDNYHGRQIKDLIFTGQRTNKGQYSLIYVPETNGGVPVTKDTLNDLQQANSTVGVNLDWLHQIKRARQLEQQSIDATMFGWLEEGTTQKSYTQDLNQQYKQLKSLYEMYKKVGSNEGMATISDAINQFENENRSGYSLFKNGKIDLTPEFKEIAEDVFTAEGIDAEIAKEIKEKYQSIINFAINDIKSINNEKFANAQLKEGSDSTNDAILRTLRLNKLIEGLDSKLNETKYNKTGRSLLEEHTPYDIMLVSDIKDVYSRIQTNISSGKYDTDAKSFQTDYALLKSDVDTIVNRIKELFALERERVNERQDNRENAFNAAKVSMASKLDAANRFRAYGSGITENTVLSTGFTTKEYYEAIQNRIKEFEKLKPDETSRDDLYEEIRQTQFAINKIFQDMKDSVKAYKDKINKEQADAKKDYQKDVTSYKREKTLGDLLQDAKNLDAISKIEDTTKTNFYNYYKSIGAPDKRVEFDTQYARINQKLMTNGYANDLEFTKDIDGLKAMLEELKVVAKIWSERENEELKAEEQFNKNLDNLLNTAEKRVDKEQKQARLDAGQELIDEIKSEQSYYKWEQEAERRRGNQDDVNMHINAFFDSLNAEMNLQGRDKYTRGDMLNRIDTTGDIVANIMLAQQDILNGVTSGAYINDPNGFTNALNSLTTLINNANTQINQNSKRENSLQVEVRKMTNDISDFERWLDSETSIDGTLYKRGDIQYRDKNGQTVTARGQLNDLQNTLSSLQSIDVTQMTDESLREQINILKEIFSDIVKDVHSGVETIVTETRNGIQQRLELQRLEEKLMREAMSVQTTGLRNAGALESQLNKIVRNPTMNTLFANSGDPYLKGNIKVYLTEEEGLEIGNRMNRIQDLKDELLREVAGESKAQRIARWTQTNEQLAYEQLAHQNMIERIGVRVRPAGEAFNEYQEVYAPLMQRFAQTTGFNIFKNPNERSVNWETIARGFVSGNRTDYAMEIAKFINFPSLKDGFKQLYNSISKTLNGVVSMVQSAFGKIYKLGKSVFVGLSVAVGGVTASVTGAIAAFTAFGKNIITTTDEFRKTTIALTGVYRTPAKAQEMVQMAYKASSGLPLSYADAMQTLNEISAIPSVQNLLRSPNSNVSSSMLDKMFKVITSMTTMRPDKTASDAVFSLRNAMAGDLRSLQRRFDLPVNSITNIRGGVGLGSVKNDPMALLDSLSSYFDSFLDIKVINQISRTIGIITEKIKGAIDLFKSQIGNSGFYDLVLKDFQKLQDKIVDFVSSDYGKQIAKRFSNAFSNMYESVKGIIAKISGNLLNAFNIKINTNNVMDMIAGLSEAFAKTLRYVESLIKDIDFESVIKNIINTISNFDIGTIVTKAKLYGSQVIDIIKNVAKQIVDSIKWLKDTLKSMGLSDETISKGLIVTWLVGPGNAVNTISSVISTIPAMINTGLGTIGSAVAIKSALDMSKGIGASTAVGGSITAVGGLVLTVGKILTVLGLIYAAIKTPYKVIESLLTGFVKLVSFIRKEIVKTASSVLKRFADLSSYFMTNEKYNKIINDINNDRNKQLKNIKKERASAVTWVKETVNPMKQEFNELNPFADKSNQEEPKTEYEVQKALMDSLVASIKKANNGLEKTGNCAKYVNKAFNELGIDLLKGHAEEVAYRAEHNPNLRKLDINSYDELRRAYQRGGLFATYGKTKSHPHGHVEITIGGGKGMSDHTSNIEHIIEQLKKGEYSDYKVYAPISTGKFTVGDSLDAMMEYAEKVKNEIGKANYTNHEPEKVETDYIAKIRTESKKLDDEIRGQRSKVTEAYGFDTVSKIFGYGEDVNSDTIKFGSIAIERMKNNITNVIGNVQRLFAEFEQKTKSGEIHQDKELLKAAIDNVEKTIVSYEKQLAETIEKSAEMLEDAVANMDFQYIGKDVQKFVSAQSRTFDNKLLQEVMNNIRQQYSGYFVVRGDSEGATGLINNAVQNRNGDLKRLLNDYSINGLRPDILQNYSVNMMNSMIPSSQYQGTQLMNVPITGIIGSQAMYANLQSDILIVDKIMQKFKEFYEALQPVVDEQNRIKVMVANVNNMRLGELNSNWNLYMTDKNKAVRSAAGERYMSLLNEGIETDTLEKMATRIVEITTDSFSDIRTLIANGVKQLVTDTQTIMKNGIIKLVTEGGTVKPIFKEMFESAKKTVIGVYAEKVANDFTGNLFKLITGSDLKAPKTPEEQHRSNVENGLGSIDNTNVQILETLKTKLESIDTNIQIIAGTSTSKKNNIKSDKERQNKIKNIGSFDINDVKNIGYDQFSDITPLRAIYLRGRQKYSQVRDFIDDVSDVFMTADIDKFINPKNNELPVTFEEAKMFANMYKNGYIQKSATSNPEKYAYPFITQLQPYSNLTEDDRFNINQMMSLSKLGWAVGSNKDTQVFMTPRYSDSFINKLNNKSDKIASESSVLYLYSENQEYQDDVIDSNIKLEELEKIEQDSLQVSEEILRQEFERSSMLHQIQNQLNYAPSSAYSSTDYDEVLKQNFKEVDKYFNTLNNGAEEFEKLRTEIGNTGYIQYAPVQHSGLEQLNYIPEQNPYMFNKLPYNAEYMSYIKPNISSKIFSGSDIDKENSALMMNIVQALLDSGKIIDFKESKIKPEPQQETYDEYMQKNMTEVWRANQNELDEMNKSIYKSFFDTMEPVTSGLTKIETISPKVDDTNDTLKHIDNTITNIATCSSISRSGYTGSLISRIGYTDSDTTTREFFNNLEPSLSPEIENNVGDMNFELKLDNEKETNRFSGNKIDGLNLDLSDSIKNQVGKKGKFIFRTNDSGNVFNRYFGGFMSTGNNAGKWFNNMLFGTGTKDEATGMMSGNNNGVMGIIGEAMSGAGNSIGGLGGLLSIGGGLASGKGILSSIGSFLGSSANLTSPAGIVGTVLGGGAKLLMGGKIGGAVASKVTGALTGGIGSAILPVAAVAYGISKLTKTKDKTAEGRARYSDFQSLKQGLLDRRYEFESTYALASDMTRGMLTSYNFGNIGFNVEHKGGTKRHLKGTARDVAHTDATAFINSLTGYHNLLMNASKEQGQGKVKLDLLQSTDNMEYLKQSNQLVSKQAIVNDKEMKKYQDAMKKYAGKDAKFKQTLFDGKEYTLAELEEKVEEFIKTFGDLSEQAYQLSEEMRKEQLNTEYAKLDYKLALDNGNDPLLQYKNEIEKLNLEWASVNNGKGYTYGTREWYEFQTKMLQATQNLENATEDMEKSTKELEKSIGSDWVKTLSGIRKQEGTYLYTQVREIAELYSYKRNDEMVLAKGEYDWGEKLTKESRKALEQQLEQVNDQIDHLTAQYTFRNRMTSIKQNISDSMIGNYTAGMFGAGTKGTMENILDYANSLFEVNKYSGDFLKTGAFSGYDDFMEQIISPLVENINTELTNMVDVYNQLYNSGYYSRSTGESKFLKPMNNYLNQLDTYQTAYISALQSGNQNTISKALKNLEKFLSSNSTYFKQLGTSFAEAKKLLNQNNARESVMSSIAGFDDYEIANTALKNMRSALGNINYEGFNQMLGAKTGMTSFTNSNIKKWFGVTGEDPYTVYYEWQKKNILQRIENEQEGSDEWYQAELDLWNLMMENAKHLKEKAEKTSQTIEDMLGRIEETAKLRVAEEAKSQKGDIIFFDLGASRDGTKFINSMLKAIKSNDPEAQKLIAEFRKKKLGV